jgi:hypothetical protein
VQVLGAHAVHVLLQHAQQLEAALEQHAVRHVHGADAADVLVHDLLEALQTVDRQQVARRYGPGGDLVAADAKVLERLVDRLLESRTSCSLTCGWPFFMSFTYFTAALAAMRPSVKEPDENLWAVPPMVSPAPNRPSTVIMRL